MQGGEIGVGAGGTFYLGDLSKQPFRESKFAWSAFYRHTFNTRLAVTGKFNTGKIAGNDDKSTNMFQINRGLSFNRRFYDVEAQFNYNFLKFLPANKNYYYTTYVFAGGGLMYYPQGENTKLFPNIPFGVGFKFNISTKLVMGTEISFKKTFSDYLDFDYNQPSENNPNRQVFYAGNKDWYAIFGVNLAYKINYRMKCPAFD